MINIAIYEIHILQNKFINIYETAIHICKNIQENICDVPREMGTNAENIANLFLVSIDSFGVALSSKKIRKNF